MARRDVPGPSHKSEEAFRLRPALLSKVFCSQIDPARLAIPKKWRYDMKGKNASIGVIATATKLPILRRRESPENKGGFNWEFFDGKV